MRNLFTRFLLIVFLSGIVYQTYAGGSAAPVPPLSSDIASLWPEAQSVTQAQPGTGNVFVLEFAKDLHPSEPFGNQGVLGLIWESEGLGYQQVETINPVVDPRVTKVGARTIEVRFNYDFEEDETYHITVEADAFRFADGEWFEGISYDTPGIPAEDPQWQFTVDDVTPPLMENCSAYGAVNGQFGVSVTQDPITICFSEPVFWAAGADPYKIGNIAFYLAAKAGLYTNDEFGGDVIYAQPNIVVLYDDEGTVIPLPDGPEVTSIESFSKIEIYLKGEPDIPNGDLQGAPPIGNDVWPANRDIYMRFAGDLLVDAAGNPFAGVHNSPYDPYSVGGQEYWFSTRENDEIIVDAELLMPNGSPRGIDPHKNVLLAWADDNIMVTIQSSDLEFITDAAITNSNVKNFIKLSIDGVDVPFSALYTAGNPSTFLINPSSSLPENKELLVEVLGGVIRNNLTLKEVDYFSTTFQTGDFSAPVVTASIMNQLCTNFDIRVQTDEPGRVYYAIVEESYASNWGTVNAADVIDGNVYISSSITEYFNNVGVPVAQYGNTPANWQVNYFNITPSLTAQEKVDDFTLKNHGDKYRVYYFTLDPTAQASHSISGIPQGKISGVSRLNVQLTDCKEPEVAWFYQQSTNNSYVACATSTTIGKQGAFQLKFPTGAFQEGIFLVGNNDWEDVLELKAGVNCDVAEPEPVEIKSIVPIMSGSNVIGVTVTPLNSYPSGGCAIITLASGAIEDAAGNAINEPLVCQKTVVTYADPLVKTFTVDNKTQEFPLDTDCPNKDTHVAKKNGKITIEFNNPMYTPERDESQSPNLVPISNDPLAANYVGNYVKLRVGDETTAEVTSNIATAVPLVFALTKNAQGGVTKIVATPQADYASETWYYVELERELQDENRVDLNTIHNNTFADLHCQYWISSSDNGNQANYFMRFRTEDTVAPMLHFVFEKFEAGAYPDGSAEWPYITPIDEDMVYCTNPAGQGTEMVGENGIPVGVIITEWSQLGFDTSSGYFVMDDPNGLRPYFKLKNEAGDELKFDVVVLNIYEPDNTTVPGWGTGYEAYFVDAIWFGLVPWDAFGENETYTVEFDPTYRADENSAFPEGAVFIDDNGNPLIADTYVQFVTCEDVTEPDCFTSTIDIETTEIGGNDVVDNLSPVFTVTFGSQFTPMSYMMFDFDRYYFSLTGGGEEYFIYNPDYFVIDGNTITVPFEAWRQINYTWIGWPLYTYIRTGTSPVSQLDQDTEYTLSIVERRFRNVNDEDFRNCEAEVSFHTPYYNGPVVNYLSPDIDWETVSNDVGNDANTDATQISVRTPGKLTIGWDVPVSVQAGKIIQIWQDGTTLRRTFTSGAGFFDALTNRWSVDLPKDFFQPNARFHVDVEAGFVVDAYGYQSAHLTGNEDRLDGGDGTTTWTFQTGEFATPAIVAWSPVCVLEPGTQNTQVIPGTQTAKINKITLTADQGVNPVDGKFLIVRKPDAGEPDLLVINVSTMIGSQGNTVWTYTPTSDFIVDLNTDYIMTLQDDAFVANYPAGSTLTTPGFVGENYLGCDTEYEYTFRLEDISAPTVKIWPENGDDHVPFNAHGYVRFSESMVAKNGGAPLVLTQSNIKNWIKVLKEDAPGAGTYTALPASDYVCEFVNLERTHVRITFLDEDAPAIDGVTANMVDEWRYKIEVRTQGDNNYYLQDNAGNLLGESSSYVASSIFKTEDIIAPAFTVTTCDYSANSVSITFTPMDQTIGTRTYPAEKGTVYYKVLPADAQAPTAAQLFSSGTAVVLTDANPKVETYSGGSFDLSTGYNFKVYAVMKDAETDLYVADKNFSNAWPTSDPIFVGAGDTNPALGAVGLADIRPAPNKNMTVMSWEFCYCDDDAPIVTNKQYNEELNVPVDATFEITFDEMIAFDGAVFPGGSPTGGFLWDPNFGHEIRLRKWDNNVSVPIKVDMNGNYGFIITPVDGSGNPKALDGETRYYIEIDRWVVMDQPGSNCESYENEGQSSCNAGCPEDGNYFEGWIGREDWWFQTHDAVPPVLTAVSPLGSCVAVNTNKVVFTFAEKNGMQINTLSGQANNLYIYKDGETVPYEIISAPGVIAGGSGTWTITYPISKTFDSEESYFVLWHKDKFTDTAIPVPHAYTESLADVVDYPANTDWHQFKFTAADSKMPVAHWAVVNYTWNSGGVKLAEGTFDNNDVLAATVDLCELGKVPQEIGFVVWFDEPINLASVSSTPSGTYNDRLMQANFFLEAGWNVKWVADGTAGSGGVTVHGVDVPEGKRYFVLQPLTTLTSNGEFQFGIKANAISDDNAVNCRENILPKTTLVNFCIWDADQAVAQLFDGDEDEIFNGSTCVAERPSVRLKFDKKMAKTDQVSHYFDPWGYLTGENYNNIWLGAQAVDFQNSASSQIIRFYEVGGAYVEFESVEVVKIGEEFIFWLKEPLKSEGNYNFEIVAGALKDIVRIPDGNSYGGKVWNFTVTDWIAPEIALNGLTPADGAANISPMAPLKIVFNEEVTLGTGAYIVIRSNEKVYYTYAANNSANVTLGSDKKTVTINHGGLDPDTEYFVEIEAGFVYDRYCGFLPFEGSAEQSYVDPEWNFTTGDVDGPVASLEPVPGDPCVELDANLVIRFDENIQLTDNGVVHIYKVRENETWHGTNFGDIVDIIPFTTANYPQVKITGSDVANGRTHDIVTITPSLGLWESDATYYVRIIGNGTTEWTEADIIEDVTGNSWMYPIPDGHGFTLLPGIHHNQWHFTIGNNDEPVLVGLTPEWGDVVPAGVASATTDLSMTFEGEVAFGTGSIKVYEFIESPEGGTSEQQANLVAEFMVPEHVNDGTITLSDELNKVTIHGVELLDGINWYYVTVDPGTITNNVECTLRGWSGISNPDQWLFSTAPDVTAPVLDDFAITSDACSEQYLKPATIEFELEFSEGVSVANGTGLVEIREVGGDVVASATIVPNMIEDNILKMVIADFTGAIADQTQYELVIGGDAIHDNATASLAGTQDPVGLVPFGNENWFAGVVLPFETGDFTAPTATQFVALDGVQDDMNALENAITMVVTFDEAVQDGAGLLHLVNADTDAVVATFDAANDEDSDPLTVTFSTNLPDETSYYVLVDEGFVTDMLYNDACDAVRNNVAMDVEDAWSFTIDDNTIPAITADLTEDTDNLMMSFDIVLQYNDIISAVDANKATLTLDGNAVPSGVTGAVVGADPTQVIVSVTVAMDQTDYMLSLADGFALDDATYANASEAVVTGPYHVGDRTIPVLEANMPVGILTSYIDVEVAVDFFDDSELSVVAPFLVLDADDNEVAQWTPDLKNEEQTASFYPTLWFGSYKVVIPAGSVVDANGNAFGGHTWNFSIIDNIFDTDCLTKANFQPADAASCVTATPDLVIEFCERIAALATDKYVKVYELNNTADNEAVAEILVTNAMINLNVLTIPLDATTILAAYNDGKGMLKDNQDYIVMIDDGAIYDEAGNSWEGISDPTFWNFTTGDNTAPTAVLVPAEGTNTKNAIAVNVEFSEPVLGAVDKVTVAGATSYTVVATADPLVYTVNIDAVDLATITVTVPTTITDVNCNFNALAEEVTGTYVVGDNTPPTVTVTAAPANPMNTERTFTVELTFSEVVAGVTKEAALANSVGLVDVATTDNIVYTLTFEGADETEGVLNLNKDLVTDVSANANKLVEGINWVFKVGDWVAPTAVVEPASGSDLRDAVLNVNVTFSEEVVGATLGQGIVVTGGTATISNDGLVYTVAITANDGATVTLTLNNKIKDDSFNANALANTDSYSYTFGDRTPPTVSVDPATAVSTPTSFDVLIVFNEDVTGAGTGSILLTGEGAQISLTPVVAGRVYKATLTGAEKAELTLSFTNAIKDLAGNPLVPASFTYIVGDYTAPTMTADPASGNFITNEIVVTLTFDEDVTGVAAATTVSAGSVVVTGEGSVYTAVITAPSLSTVTLTVGSAVEDLAGNNFAGANFSYTVTGLVPIATIQGEVSTSPLVGKVLQVEGTITGISPFEGFFVQDASAAWSGIWVAYNNTEGLAIGDGVHITGQVAEVSSVTTINASAVTEIDAPLTVAPVVVASPNDAKKEMYESVLVQVLGAEASEANDIGDWVVAYAPLNRVTVANWFYLYTPVAGYSYHVTGIVNARLGNFKLEPRMRADIEAGNIETVQSKGSQSAWIGETVNLTATVTGVVPAEGFFMQDANAAWSGVWVAFGNNANLSVGDGVHVSGVVAEVSNVTTINAVTVTKVTAPIAIEPVVVANSEAGSPAAAKQEQYESVLVKVEGARANAANDIGQWTIYYQPIQNVVVNNWMYAYTPEADHYYDVTGVVNARLDNFRLEPRMSSDIVDLTLTSVDPVKTVEFSVYPNPFNTHINIDNHDKLSRVVITNIAGQRVMDVTYPEHQIRTDNLVSGVYVVSMFTEEGLAKTERIVKR